jgi:hypothetical protein
MTDKALQNALARKDEIAKEINGLNDKLADLKREAERVDRFIAEWKSFAGETEEDSQDDLPGFAPHERGAVGNVIRQFARAAIAAANRPLPRKDLYAALEQHKIKINGKNPLMGLSTIMWRLQDEFVRIPGFGYWFRDRPFPGAKYKPGDIPDSRTKKEDQENEELEDLLG